MYALWTCVSCVLRAGCDDVCQSMRQAAAATMPDECECYVGANAEHFVLWKVRAHKARQQRRPSSRIGGFQKLLERAHFFESPFLRVHFNAASLAGVRVLLGTSLVVLVVCDSRVA